MSFDSSGSKFNDLTAQQAIPSAVSTERWLAAQKWELEFWNRQNIPPVWWKRVLRPFLVMIALRSPRQKTDLDDRNHWWAKHFDQYRILPTVIENACELGCGPYTNIRIIRIDRRIESIHCSDPLAKHYVRYGKAWLANAVRSGLVNYDSHPAEQCPYKSNYFGLTVLINVLDHVRDAEQCLREAVRITAVGGYIVFGQDLTGLDDRRPHNPGHPFLLNHRQLESFLNEHFDTLFWRIAPREEMAERDMHYGALVYIGRKR
ncbi:MAG: class I SAM-dependent methyltransferase [Gammaproteobacteria bacterium]|nr:class I SAM-dependent methyltransferase [Gammaproteobacteria bacterium]